jgi:DNA-binding Lrp family transcriptional regulator
MLLVWGVRDEVLKKIPVDGQWLYGEYDFIAKVEFADLAEMEEFERLIRRIINGNTYKLLPVKISAIRRENGGEFAILESSEEIATV